jgi:hypothetical protein
VCVGGFFSSCFDHHPCAEHEDVANLKNLILITLKKKLPVGIIGPLIAVYLCKYIIVECKLIDSGYIFIATIGQ